MKTVLAAVLLVPALAFAGSPFDGTWKTRTESIRVTGKPDVIVLQNGNFSCASCVPAFTVKADGQEHAVAGHPDFDALTVLVVSPATVKTVWMLNGKVTHRETNTISIDGQTLSGTFSDYSGAKEQTGTFTESRIAEGPPASHAISGSWQVTPGGMTGNDAATTVQYQLSGDHFKANFNGHTYDAPLDGTEVPLVGDAGHTTVSVKRVAPNTVLETDHRAGKVTDEIRIVAAADGKSLSFEDQDLEHGQTITFVLDRQ
jgi:hypothetical protein